MWYIRYKRAIFVCIALAGIFVGPWWITPFAMLLLALRFQAWEVPCIGLCADVLWGAHGFLPLYTLFGLILTWVFEPLRERLLL